jgi:hypothetical protein
MEKYGFVYIWYDRKHKRYYIGAHWGSENDGYICSSPWMKRAYKLRPNDFKRRILNRVYTNRQEMFDEEAKWQNFIKDDELRIRYYNIRRHGDKHWSADPNKALTVKEKLKAADATRGLRAHAVSMRGKTLSEETKKKISQSTKLALASLDKSYRLDEDYRKKISENSQRLQQEGKIGMLGKTHSNKTKEKMSKSQSGSNNPMHNKTHDEEAKRKISEASKLMWAKRRMEKA